MNINKSNFGKTLLLHFIEVFDELQQVHEVGTIFTEKHGEKNNESPIHVENNCIGLEKWSIKYLYMHAYKHLMEHLDSNHLLDNSIQLESYTRCVVLFCSDCTSAWNVRKQLINTSSFADTAVRQLRFTKELHLTKLALRRHPKSTEAFAHRRWLLLHLFDLQNHSNVLLNEISKLCPICGKIGVSQKRLGESSKLYLKKSIWNIVENELKIAQDAAEWHLCNYHAWSHRVWVISSMILPLLCSDLLKENFSDHKQGVASSTSDLLKILKKELSNTCAWMELHVSDHSCMAYAQFILKIITATVAVETGITCTCTNESFKSHKYGYEDLCKMWLNTLEHCNDLLELHSGLHEALWVYRRSLFLLFHKFFKLLFVPLIDSASSDILRKLNLLYSRKSEEDFCQRFNVKLNSDTDALLYKHIFSYLKYIRRFVFHETFL